MAYLMRNALDMVCGSISTVISLLSVTIMAKRNKPHRNTNHKRNITLIACILRLRSQPSVPYPEIAEILTTTLSDLTVRFAKKTAPSDVKSSSSKYGMREWLTKWLEETFDQAEDWNSTMWIKARDWDEQNVKMMLEITGLEKKGYVMAGQEEMKCQIRWRKEGDWRAGSEPLGRPVRIYIKAEETPFESSGSLSYSNSTQRAPEQLPNKQEQTPKYFEDQIREVLLLKDAFRDHEILGSSAWGLEVHQHGLG